MQKHLSATLVLGLLAAGAGCGDELAGGPPGEQPPASPGLPAAQPPRALVPDQVNAIRLADGTLLALERVGPGAPRRAFRHVGPLVEVYDEQATLLAAHDVGVDPAAAQLFGGFDLDGDALVDFGVARREPAGAPCGGAPMQRTRLELFATATGARLLATDDAQDLCWSYPTTSYPTQQWTALGVLFGPTPGRIATMPYYAAQGQVRELAAGGAVGFAFPSTAAFDAYPAARPNAHGEPHDYERNSHVANGLFLRVGESERLLFFTSARLAVYAADGSGLLADYPYLSGGRRDLLGRNYGVVAVDPAAPARIALVAGTSVATLRGDMLRGQLATDPWGGIERHVSRFDAASGALLDRFFSYAHDAGDGHQYQGRIAFLAHPFLPAGAGEPSRLVFGQYTGGHWYTHVTGREGLGDALVRRGLVPWDVVDLDGDGVGELIASPTELPGDPDVPGYYFSKWQTVVLSWDEAGLELVERARWDGIPELVAAFHTATTTSSQSSLMRVAVVASGAGGAVLLLRAPDGTVTPSPRLD